MFVTIHEKTAQDFVTLGLGTLVPISCEVEEELNGAFELELEHPYDEWGKWKRIEKARIIVASTPRGPQPFRIYQVKPDMDGIKVNARHIFYDLLDNMVSLKYTGTAAGALEAFQGAFNFAQPFAFDTDISISGTMSVGKMNPVQALLCGDDDNSGFIQTYGGELLRDGYHVSVKNSLGRDNGVAIRYGKNLTGLEITEDEEDVKTRIHLYNERGQSVTLDSPRIGEYPYPKIYIGEESSATQSELQKKAQELLDGGIDLPSVNIKVEFIPLAKTVEYAEFAILEEARLGDIVTVVNQKMNFSKQAKAISYHWDCLLEQYDELELGDFMPTLVTSVTSGARSGSLASSANATASVVATMLQNHLKDYTNPHRVTAEQTGGSSGGDCQAILYGEAEPDNGQGADGDLYIKREVEVAYTPLAYIESTGEQYIDALYKVKSSDKIEMIMEFTEEQTTQSFIFGSTSTADMERYGVTYIPSLKYWRNTLDKNMYNFPTSLGAIGKHTVIKDGNKCSIDGVQGDTATAEFSSSQSMCLFCRNTNGTKELFASMRLYSCGIYNEDTTIRDFIPVLDPSGVACLYDKVSYTYFYNVGSGAFIAGPALEKEKTGGALYIKINGTWKLALKGAA